MAISIRKFDPETAGLGHWGTILASDVLPEGVKAPFEHQYGYLRNNGTMGGHAHPTDEIYIVLSGTGYVVVNGKNKAVRAGDVIAIPPNEWHTMMCTDRDEAPFLWAALWWEHIGPPIPQEALKTIHVRRFEKEKAQAAHGGTILAAPVVPDLLQCPFGHAYGYVENGGVMEEHAHPTVEIYVVYEGNGTIVIDGEEAPIGPGDVIAIPSNAQHSLKAPAQGGLLWAAFWWDPQA